MKSTKRTFIATGLLFSLVLNSLLPTALAAAPGTASEPALWFNADKSNVFTDDGTTEATDRDVVQQWKDISNNAVTAEQETYTRKTVWFDDHLNFNPAIYATSGDYLLMPDGSLPTGNESYTVFFGGLRSGNGNIASVGARGNNKQNRWGAYRADPYDHWTDSQTAAHEATGAAISSDTSAWAVNTYGVATYKYDGSAKTLRDGGTNVAMVSTTAPNDAQDENHTIVGDVGLGYTAMTGYYGDVIVYKTALADADIQKVESYLAIKYGVTLDAGVNYVSSAGSTIWDSVINTDYHNDIAGIGNSSASSLDQKVSTSQNLSGIIVTMATTNDFELPNADASRTSLADNSFLLWGNNTQRASAWTDEKAPSGFFRVGASETDARVWKTQETGTVGAVNLEVNVQVSGTSNIPAIPTTGANESHDDLLYLLIDNDGDFSDAESVLMTDAGSNKWTVSHDFATDKPFFTFGYKKKVVNDVTINVEMITPNGDGGLGPFDVKVTCRNGDVHDFSLAGGASASFTYPGDTNLRCLVSSVLTAAQKPFFKIKRGDDFGRNDGWIAVRNSNDAEGKTLTMTATYVPEEVVDFQVAKVVEGGDDGGLGPFPVKIACSNGDEYEFEMEHGDVETFQYEKGAGMRCRVIEELTVEQKPFFKTRRGDTFGPNNGGMAGNSTTASASTGTLKGGVAYTQGTFEAYSEYIPEEVVDFQVTKVVKDGIDGGLGPFDIKVACSNGDEYEFEMANGEVETFQYEKGVGMRCRVSETLRPTQEGFFKIRKGDTFGPNNGNMVGNSTSANGSTGTLKGGVAYTQGTFEVYNEYVPAGTVKLNVTKETPNGDNDLGMFDVKITCANGEDYEFEMDGGETENFYYNRGDDFDCSVSETLRANQSGQFNQTFGDDFENTSDGTMTILDSNAVDGKTFTVTNDLTADPIVTLNVKKEAPNGDGGLGPFAINVTCSNGDTHDFSLNAGESGTFTYPRDTAMRCRVTETLTTAQKPFFKMKRGDDFGRNDGRIVTGSSNTANGKTFTVTNTYVPEEVVDFQVTKVVKDGIDGGLGPFDINVACSNGDEYEFEMANGEVETFQYEKGVGMRCRVSETLRPTQEGFFKIKKGDTFGPNNGNMVGNSTTASASTGTLKGGVAYTQGTFEVYNEYVPAGTVKLNVTKETPNGDGSLGPFDVNINCANGENYAFEMDGGETENFYYTKGEAFNCSVSELLSGSQSGQFIQTLEDDFETTSDGTMTTLDSNEVDNKTFTVENDFQSNDITVNVKKVLTNGGDAYGPFAINVTCSNGAIHDFSLNGGESGTFTYPKDQNIDCSVSETLSATQVGKFTTTLSDDFGPNDGRIMTLETLTANGSTLTVSNALIDGNAQCPATVTSKVWNGMSNTQANQSVTLEKDGQTINFALATTNGQWANRNNATQVGFAEDQNGNYMITPDQPLFNVELFFASITNSAVGNFTLTFENGQVITNAPFAIINDTVSNNGAMGDFMADLNDDALLQVTTINGFEYLVDPTNNGEDSQAAARIQFSGISGTPSVNDVTKIEFEVITQGNNTSTLGVMGLKTGVEIPGDCEKPPVTPVTETKSGGPEVRTIIQVCDGTTGKVSNRFPARNSSLPVDTAYNNYQICAKDKANVDRFACAETWALASGLYLGDSCTASAIRQGETRSTETTAAETAEDLSTTKSQEISNETAQTAETTSTETETETITESDPQEERYRWNRYEDNLAQMDIYPLTGSVPGWLRDKYEAQSILPSDSADAAYYEAAVNLVRQQVVGGYNNDVSNIQLTETILRAELAKIIAIGQEAYVNADDQSTFQDVSVQDWFYPYVETLARAGVYPQLGNGQFQPAAAVTLDELMFTIGKAFNIGTDKTTFVARNLMPAEIAKKDPNETLTRGETFEVLSRMLNTIDRGTYSSQEQVEISIPTRGVENLPATNTILTDASVWLDDLTNTGAAHYYDPTNDNFVVFAHSSVWPGDPTPYGPIFKNLIGGMDTGEIIEMKENGRKAQYRVVSSALVDPRDADTARDSSDNVDLILFTCGVDYNNERWVIKAEKIEN